MEVVAAAAMLAVLIAIVGQLVAQTNRQAAVAERRDYGLMAIENAMEELTSRSWDAVSNEAIADYELPAGLTKRWPAAKLDGHVEQQSDPVDAKRVILELTLSQDGRGLPLSLATWIYRTPVNEAPR